MNKYVNDFTQTVQEYYNSLKKYKPISKEEELKLIKKAKNNNIKAKNELVTANLKFVFDVAKKYKGRGVAIEDLISEGNLGLVKAIDKFDETKNVKFISYAVWWIRQSIQECLKKRQIISINEMQDETLGVYNKDSQCINNSDDDECSLIICNNNNLLDNDEVEKKTKTMSLIDHLLSKLDKRSEYILQSYYGFDDKAMTLDAIGQKLNLSRERVRKIKEKNLRFLRGELLLNNEYLEYLS